METGKKETKNLNPEYQEVDRAEDIKDDASLTMTDITIEEVSIDGICGVY